MMEKFLQKPVYNSVNGRSMKINNEKNKGIIGNQKIIETGTMDIDDFSEEQIEELR